MDKNINITIVQGNGQAVTSGIGCEQLRKVADKLLPDAIWTLVVDFKSTIPGKLATSAGRNYEKTVRKKKSKT